MVVATFLQPTDVYLQLHPNAAESSRFSQICLQVTLDGFSTSYVIDHRMRVTAADLALGFPLIEITNPATNPPTPSSGASRISLTGPAALVGVSVVASFTSSIQLAFAAPTAAPAGTTIQVLITRNPASRIPLP